MSESRGLRAMRQSTHDLFDGGNLSNMVGEAANWACRPVCFSLFSLPQKHMPCYDVVSYYIQQHRTPLFAAVRQAVLLLLQSLTPPVVTDEYTIEVKERSSTWDGGRLRWMDVLSLLQRG